jgi:hypothetical protein
MRGTLEIAAEPFGAEVSVFHLGREPRRTADRSVWVRRGGAAFARLDLISPDGGPDMKVPALVWRERFVVVVHEGIVGWLDADTMTGGWMPLASYGCGLEAAGPFLLVAHGTGLVAFDERMGVVWSRDDLAVDGVLIGAVDVEQDVLIGSAEWDPPGGWRPFRLRLGTGELLE